jgi:hypothetical protein
MAQQVAGTSPSGSATSAASAAPGGDASTKTGSIIDLLT